MKRLFVIAISCVFLCILGVFLFKKPVLTENHKSKKLSSQYLVSFGNPNAPIKITEYFSFSCSHCLSLFRKDFASLRREYIDQGLIFWTFHPVPMDFLTIQAMDCFQKLSDDKKRALLQVYLEEAEIDNSELCTLILKEAMQVFGHPLPRLGEKEYLENTEAFSAAFNFVKENESMNAVPSVEVNGFIYPGTVPDRDFVNEIVFENRGFH